MGGILNNRFGGILFIAILWGTAFFGSMLMMGPVIPIMFINPYLFRRINDNLLALWLTLPVLLMEIFFGVKCKMTGDRLSKTERSVIIMNHRTRLDWMFFWKPLFSLSSVRSEKIILKNELKYVPGPGWAMQAACYIFLRRKWEQDKAWMAMMLDYYCDTNYRAQFLLFPEGTDLNDGSKKKSDSFATKNGLQKYEYLLHPRTTGFKFIMNHLQNRDMVDAVYDITVAYPDRIPLGGELDIVNARLPKEVHYHVKRYPISSLPPDTDFERWCVDRWQEKEVRLEQFYNGEREFAPSDDSGDHQSPPTKNGAGFTNEYALLYGAIVYWVFFIAFLVCVMAYTSIAWWHMSVVGLFFVVCSVFYGGMEQVIVDAYYWHRERTQPQQSS